MRNFLLYIGCLVLVNYSIFPLLNFFVDPGGLYNNHNLEIEKEIANKLVDGKVVTDIRYLQEGSLKRQLAESYAFTEKDYLILGASRGMCISEDAFDSASVLNLCASTSQIEDIVAFYNIAKSNSIHFKNVIVGIDPSMLTDNYDGMRWKCNKNFFYGDKDMPLYDMETIMNLFDATYTQSSLHKLYELLKYLISGVPIVQYNTSSTRNNENMSFCHDGSFTYWRTHRSIDVERVNEMAKINENKTINKENVKSQERIRIFEKFINQINDDGKKIILLFTPYHPYYYERISQMPVYKELETYLYQFAVSNRIECIGYYNPYLINISGAAFYDEVHMKADSINALVLGKNQCFTD